MKRLIVLLAVLSSLIPNSFSQNKLSLAVADSCGFNARGKSMTLTASALPNSNATISSVQFTVDGTPIGALLTAPPYTISWDSTTVPNGCHLIVATAVDSQGNSGSATLNASVKN